MIDLIKIHYYELQFAAVFGGMLSLFLLEAFIPRREAHTNQSVRWLNNILLALFNHFVLIAYALWLGILIAKYQPDTTLVRHFQLSDITTFVFILILFDFIAYWFHRASHHFPLLWKIHAVHHTDTELDVTTSHRQHPFESIIGSIIITPLIIAIGAPLVSIVLFNFVHTLIALTSHSNIKLPEIIDNIVRKFITTPDFHRMHHSSDKKYTNSNYCVIFPFFDYVFGTASRKPYETLPEMELGLENLREAKDNRVDKLLLTPFIYRPYTDPKTV